MFKLFKKRKKMENTTEELTLEQRAVKAGLSETATLEEVEAKEKEINEAAALSERALKAGLPATATLAEIEEAEKPAVEGETEIKTEEPTSEVKTDDEEEKEVNEDEIAKKIDTYLVNDYNAAPQKKTPEALCKFLTETYGVPCSSDNKSPHFIKILVGEKRIMVPFKNDQLVSVIVSSTASEAGRVQEQDRINQMDPLEVFAERIAVIIEERRSFIRPLFTKDELSEVIQRSANHPEFEFEDKPIEVKPNKKVKETLEGETAIIFKSGEGEAAKECRLPGKGYFKFQK